LDTTRGDRSETRSYLSFDQGERGSTFSGTSSLSSSSSLQASTSSLWSVLDVEILELLEFYCEKRGITSLLQSGLPPSFNDPYSQEDFREDEEFQNQISSLLNYHPLYPIHNPYLSFPSPFLSPSSSSSDVTLLDYPFSLSSDYLSTSTSLNLHQQILSTTSNSSNSTPTIYHLLPHPTRKDLLGILTSFGFVLLSFHHTCPSPLVTHPTWILDQETLQQPSSTGSPISSSTASTMVNNNRPHLMSDESSFDGMEEEDENRENELENDVSQQLLFLSFEDDSLLQGAITIPSISSSTKTNSLPQYRQERMREILKCDMIYDTDMIVLEDEFDVSNLTSPFPSFCSFDLFSKLLCYFYYF